MRNSDFMHGGNSGASSKSFYRRFFDLVGWSICILAVIGLTAFTHGRQNTTHKQLVVNALTRVFDQLNVGLIDEYYHDGYIQHSPFIKDGKAGLRGVISNMKADNVRIKREIIRTLVEDNLVYVQSRVSFGGSPANVVVDIFRIKNGKIIEHWDALQEEVPASKTASGNGMLDGGGDADKVVSAKYLAKNKRVIKKFIEKGFVNGDVELLSGLFGDQYTQHNPQVPDGKEAVLGFFSDIDGGFPAVVERIIAQGDLVAVLVEYGNDGDQFHNACVDLFRLDRRSKVVEHWDTCIAIPAANEFVHKNGMF